MLESFRLDLRTALRSLGRSPAFLIVAVLSLALGIGSSAAAFSVIDALRLRSLPFEDGDRLVLITESPVDIRQEQAGAAACREACNVSFVAYDRWLRQRGTIHTDPMVYAAVTAAIVAVSVLASLIPAHRAVRVDPAVALRAG